MLYKNILLVNLVGRSFGGFSSILCINERFRLQLACLVEKHLIGLFECLKLLHSKFFFFFFLTVHSKYGCVIKTAVELSLTENKFCVNTVKCQFSVWRQIEATSSLQSTFSSCAP